MKKWFNSILIALLALLVAQPVSAQFRRGFKAGLNLAGVAYSDDYLRFAGVLSDGTVSSKMVVAYHVGAQMEFDINDAMGIGTGFQLNVKGNTFEAEGVTFGIPYTSTNAERAMYLQVPLAFYYRKSGFYAGLGPYFGIGIGGKSKITTRFADQTSKRSPDVTFGSGGDYSTIDFGAGAELGYEIGSIRVSASFSHSIANAAPPKLVDAGKESGQTYRFAHRVVGVSVAYLFGMK